MEELGTFLVVYEEDGTPWYLPTHEEPRVDAAVTDYLDSGETRDRIVRFDTYTGTEVALRVSAIGPWFVSSPESRKEADRVALMQERETEQHRIELGGGWAE